MELFIQIRNGQPYEHPILGENFREAFPQIDVNNLPPEFARFERVEAPTPAVFEVIVGVNYEWVGGIVKDVWVSRPMTYEEKTHQIFELTAGANNVIAWRKQVTNEKIDKAPSEQIKQVWVDYLAELNAWVLVDPVNPQIPTPPVIDQNGNVMSTSSSGSAPNVFI